MGKTNRTKSNKAMSKTIEKRQIKEKETLIEYLKKTPIVQVACERTNVGRATYYRWRKEDSEFSKVADLALQEGNALVNDMAESQLMSAIKDKNMTAIIFWLKHHHPAYTTKVEVTTAFKNQEITLTDEQKQLLNKALEMAAIIPGEKKNE